MAGEEAEGAALVDLATLVAVRLQAPVVVLAGGCFRNARLLDGAVRRLAAAGTLVRWHRDLPAGDGSLSMGQAAVVAARRMPGGDRLAEAGPVSTGDTPTRSCAES